MSKIPKKILLFGVGSVLVIVGITLILVEWESVVQLFKGAGGIVLAIAGLVVLMLIKD